MPLHEFVRMSGRMHESGQQTQFSTDLSSRGFDNLAELVWENGQIIVQGQSSKFSRAPAVNYLPPTNPRPRAGAARVGKFVGLESLLGDKSTLVPSGDLDLSQDDEMAPWLGYPFDVALVQEYGSELLPEVSVVTANGLSTQNSLFPVSDKRSCFQQAVSNFRSDDHTLKASSSSKASLQCSWLPQNRQRSDGVGSGVSDIISNNTTNRMGTIFGNPNQGRDMLNDAGCKKVDRLGKEPFMSNSTLLNFSHFSRATGLMKTNLHNPIGNHASVLRIIEKVDAKGKCSATRGSNAVDCLTTGGVNNSHKNPDFHISSVTDAMVGSIQPAVKPAFESCNPERNENSCKEDLIKNDNTQVLSIPANSVKEVPNVERAVDPVVTCSSVGSGKSADRVSCDHTNNQKRKFRDIEESGSQSDDIDTESIGGQKSIPDGVGTRSKRSRAAEVHNLSERRRRDRINEKMRALQELIPNCNKTDKASILDEAIEYLKMLQLQVQMMSMGAGLYMPPMMFPTGFQQIPHFPTMGFGMGMGMGMVDSGSHVFPQIPHFPPILGPSNFLGIPSPSLPVYGQPGQGFIGSFPRPQLFPLAAQAPTIPNVGVSPANANGGHNEVIMVSSALNTVVPVTNNTTSHLMCAAEAGSSASQPSNQLRATAEKFDQSARPTDSTCPPAVTSIDKEPGSG